MEVTSPSTDAIALAGGRLAGAAAMAGSAVRQVAEYRRLAAIWAGFRRDAGAGDVGREHHGSTAGLLSVDDARRDGILLWLIDHAPASLAAAAEVAARAVGARKRLSPDALDLLAAAVDAIPEYPDDMSVGAALQWVATYVRRLRSDPGFSETSGETIDIALPHGRHSSFRSADPGGCWAANLALQARRPAIAVPVPPATLSRALFRHDLEGDERAQILRADWLSGLDRACSELLEAAQDMVRGMTSLAPLSKNARARPAWMLLSGFGEMTRGQLSRALGLSRGGASLVATQLVDARLAWLDGAGLRVYGEPPPSVSPALDDRLSIAAGDVDQAMADIDRLLARSAIQTAG